MQLAYISLFICLMQCLCIGSDGNSDTTDNDGELMTITDLIQKHHYLGQKNNKKNYSCTVLGLHLLCFSMNEKDFPKISGPTCRMNVMKIVTEILFSPLN